MTGMSKVAVMISKWGINLNNSPENEEKKAEIQFFSVKFMQTHSLPILLVILFQSYCPFNVIKGTDLEWLQTPVPNQTLFLTYFWYIFKTVLIVFENFI